MWGQEEPEFEDRNSNKPPRRVLRLMPLISIPFPLVLPLSNTASKVAIITQRINIQALLESIGIVVIHACPCLPFQQSFSNEFLRAARRFRQP